jgi:phosphatidate cytidylyltransferase
MCVNFHAGDLLAILMMLVIPLADDAFAYFVGSKFGKHKLIPAISPKKSVEGLIGGIVGGLLAQAVLFLLFEVFGVFNNVNNIAIKSISDKLFVSIPIYVVLALILIAADFAGDLVASRIKRIVGIKDYGKIFPGHGGVMDRLDSLIFAMPVVYVFFTICRVSGFLY